jgi:DNA-directed RNA polymerase subunit RPC12/RpoP
MPITETNESEYRKNEEPKCPFCDAEIDISINELYHLYEEETHYIDCPQCNNEIKVKSEAKWTFSTDEQED